MVLPRVWGCLAGHQRVPKSQYQNQSLPGGKKGGKKGEVNRGKGVREGTGLEGESGGKNEGKRVEGKGPESTLEKLWFWNPYDLGTLKTFRGATEPSQPDLPLLDPLRKLSVHPKYGWNGAVASVLSLFGILLLGGNGVGGNRGSVTAGCPSARDRKTPYRQRDATPLVLLREDQSCVTFVWQYGVAPQTANDIGPSCKKRSETVPPHQRPPHQKNPDLSLSLSHSYHCSRGCFPQCSVGSP